jgi:DNA-directed RNA polymerase specialized sigma24 family protein
VEDRETQLEAIAAERKRTQELSDENLITAMRHDEQFAFVEFIDRFRIVAWNEARGLSIDSSVRKSWTEEVLHDCALVLVRPTTCVPLNTAGYVIVAIRRRFFADRRKEQSENRLLGDFADDLRDSEQDQWSTPPEPIVKLAEALASRIDADEEALLEWKRRKLGYTQAAAWLGLKRDTVAHRTLRLTARLQKVALQHLESLADDDLRQVQRFMDRIKRGDNDR